MNGDIQPSIAADYASQFDYPITVSMIDKLTNWQELQKLTFAAIEDHIKTNFYGIQDAYKQLDAYSQTHPILQRAWSVISSLVPLNAVVQQGMYEDDVMGNVGNELQTIDNFGQVFAITPGELSDPKDITQKADDASGSSSSSS